MKDYSYSASTPLTKEFILKRVTQEEIMAYYLGEPVQTEQQFCNPLRKDRNPTCNYIWYGKKLRFRDWSWHKTMDCFDIVQHIHSCSFHEALQQIAHDFGLADTKPREEAIEALEQLRTSSNQKTITPIRVKLADRFRPADIEYLISHGVHGTQVKKYNVKPLERVWLRGRDYWCYGDGQSAIGYYFGTERGHQLWQIYFYQREDGPRFLSNCGILQGYEQLPDSGRRLVITKSLKDVMALDHFGIPAVAPMGETQPIDEETMTDLIERFDQIVTLFDFDATGVAAANRLYKEYDIPALFFGDGRFGTQPFESKDFSEYVRRNGEPAARRLIRQVADPDSGPRVAHAGGQVGDGHDAAA